MLKVFLVEDEFVIREGIKIILTGRLMAMSSVGRPATESWPIP